MTFEPGATRLGQALRPLALGVPGMALDPTAEALLMLADRAQHVAEVVGPALAGGRWVVTDRYGASTLAYQGYGRAIDLDLLVRLQAWVTGGVEPDLNVLIDLPVGDALARRGGRATDGIESLDGGFHGRVADGFRAQAAADPAHWLVVDGRPDPDTVAASVRTGIASRLGMPSGTGGGA